MPRGNLHNPCQQAMSPHTDNLMHGPRPDCLLESSCRICVFVYDLAAVGVSVIEESEIVVGYLWLIKAVSKRLQHKPGISFYRATE